MGTAPWSRTRRPACRAEPVPAWAAAPVSGAAASRARPMACISARSWTFWCAQVPMCWAPRTRSPRAARATTRRGMERTKGAASRRSSRRGSPGGVGCWSWSPSASSSWSSVSCTREGRTPRKKRRRTPARRPVTEQRRIPKRPIHFHQWRRPWCRAGRILLQFHQWKQSPCEARLQGNAASHPPRLRGWQHRHRRKPASQISSTSLTATTTELYHGANLAMRWDCQWQGELSQQCERSGAGRLQVVAQA
mmetsp:Transcript_33284/g.103770  ORF Transcript_33284/g.103770 Transcript_33284/m.103770 type:complete len:250 (+) Transcript_33284:587-1336(+)